MVYTDRIIGWNPIRCRTLWFVHPAPETGNAGSIRGVHQTRGFFALWASGRVVVPSSRPCHRGTGSQTGHSPTLRAAPTRPTLQGPEQAGRASGDDNPASDRMQPREGTATAGA